MHIQNIEHVIFSRQNTRGNVGGQSTCSLGRTIQHLRLRGVFGYDSITVSSAWELTSVSMPYSQGNGVNTSLSKIMYCTHELCSAVFGSVRLCSLLDPFLLCGYLPWHGHVLPGTQVMKIMCVNQQYQQG